MNISSEAIQEIERIRTDNDGTITPQLVVDAATDQTSPLHTYFTWDADEGAARFRRIEAGRLLKRYTVMVHRQGRPDVQVSVLYNTEENDRGERVYRHIDEIVSDPDIHAALKRRVLAQLQALRKRYSHIQELAEIWAAIDITMNEAA